MAIRTEPFVPAHLPALRRFAERVWQRPRSDAFYRWRYLEAPTLRAYLALRGEECLALLAGFARPYDLGGRSRTCLEIHDWYCLPELHASGLGIQLMRAAMREEAAIVAVDGTADTLALLPRLGFAEVARIGTFSLPLTGGAVAGTPSRRGPVARALLRLAWRAGPSLWFRPRRGRPPPRGRVVAVGRVGAELQALYAGETGYGTLPRWVPEHLHWLCHGWPGLGHFLPLYFLVGGQLRGFGLVRIFEAPGGREAALVELFAPRPDPRLCAWMVSEASAAGAGLGARWVRAQSSCPVLRGALRANRFLLRDEAPLWIWCADGAKPPGPLHVGLDAADGPLLPYPASFPDGEPDPGARS
jgi:hypothetical protein